MEMVIESTDKEDLPIELEVSKQTEMELPIEKEVETEIYVELEVAAKMADRSTRTIRNWLKTNVIDGKKEDPDNSRSKWLINRQSLMTYLATEADPNPPRKQGTDQTPIESQKIISVDIPQNLSQNAELETLKKDFNQELQQKQGVITKQEKEIAELKMQLEMANFKLTQKDELIEMIRQMQPHHNAVISGYEERLAELQKRLLETEMELSVVSDRYALECSKGILARIFTRPQEFKLLPDNQS